MRVALLHMRHAATGGTERYLNGLARWLGERGDDVAVVCRSHEQAPHANVRFEVLRPLALGASARMWSFARAVEAHVARARYDVVVGLGKTWTHDVVRLGGGCHASYLEHAHEHTQRPLERALGLAQRKQRSALAIEQRALAPHAYQLAICNSRMVKADLLARYGGDPERVEVVYNGVDLTRFDPRKRAHEGARLRAELQLEHAAPLLLFVGSGFGRKGLDTLLEALPAALRARPRAHLLVVGGDSQRARYERRAQALGIGARVRFAGERRDVEACFAAADLYCLPTRYDAFANSTLEALASGLPVLTSDANGAAESVTSAVGAVVRATDVDALARRLLEWTSPERLEPAREPARALAQQHSLAAMAQRTAALLDLVAQRKRAARA